MSFPIGVNFDVELAFTIPLDGILSGIPAGNPRVDLVDRGGLRNKGGQ